LSGSCGITTRQAVLWQAVRGSAAIVSCFEQGCGARTVLPLPTCTININSIVDDDFFVPVIFLARDDFNYIYFELLYYE
jgi:hypothetical protein